MYVAPSGASFGVYSRCMRPSGKAATIFGFPQRLTGRGSGLAESSRGNVCHSLAGGPGGSRRMVHIPTGTLARGMQPWSFPTSILIPAVLFAPLSGCSRQHWRLVCVPLRHVLPIRVSGFRGASDPITLVKPHVRRETVAAGRDLTPATVLNPGAGPTSPDIASSGVSEGGTGKSLREEKSAGMKKCVGV
jgi:hypothetical protein